MNIHILGLGDSIKGYEPHPKHTTFGVNDIERHIGCPVDYLVVVNSESNFTTERRRCIANSRPKRKFFGIKYHTKEWSMHADQTIITFKNCYNEKGLLKGNISIDDKTIYSGMSSPFMVVQIAYKEFPDVKKMYIFGVDYVNHWAFSGHRLEKELSYWKWLFKQLKGKGITIVLPPESMLNQIL